MNLNQIEEMKNAKQGEVELVGDTTFQKGEQTFALPALRLSQAVLARPHGTGTFEIG